MAERLAGGQSASKPTAPGRRSVSADRPARRQSARRQFDVFLSHNGADKPFVESVARELRRQGLEPWLDRWYLVPGREWMDDLPTRHAGPRLRPDPRAAAGATRTIRTERCAATVSLDAYLG